MPNFNPLSNDAEDTSFEQGSPVSQAVKSASKAVNTQMQQQADDLFKQANDDIVSLLYGPSTPQEPGTDETNTQHTDASNAATRAAATHAAVSGQAGKAVANTNPNLSPEEQAKMEKIRGELFGNYSMTFKAAAVNGAQNITTNLEQETEKARKEREQKELQRKQDEEREKEERERQEQEAQQELAMPAGKKTGMTMGKPKQEPMALRQAQTKTEINRGSTG